MITVRAARPEDRTRLQQIGEAAVRIVRRTYRPNPARLAARGGRRTVGIQLVAVEDGRVVGAVSYEREGAWLHLRNLAVDPACQRRGVARRLIEAACDLALERKLSGLSLETIRETGNVPIFERLGFTAISESPSRLMEGARGEAVTDVRLYRPALLRS